MLNIYVHCYSTDKPGNRIADKIAENFSSACLAIVSMQ